MKLSSSIISVLLFLAISVKANESTLLLDSANAAYSKASYEKAIKLYEDVIGKGDVSSELYFNLGNAYYKAGNIGFAILNYERAKKLSPEDDDITVNLKLANQKTEDKIEAAPQLFLTSWKNSVIDLMSEKGWSLLCILFVTISLILFVIYIFTASGGLKQVGFFGGTVLMLFSIIIFFLAKHKYYQTITSSDAIIVAPTVTVMGSPNEKGTKLFVLHEGTKVAISEEDGEWTEVKIANGNVGWVQNRTISPI